MISSRTDEARTGEAGVTLILALAFVTVMGAFIVGLLALTDTNFKATQVTRARVDAVYTADGGADFALEQIRTTATSQCPPTLSAIPAINGVVPTISVECSGGTTTSGGSSLLGTYSAIALGSAGVSVGGSAQNGDNLTVKFLGDIYSAGGVGGISGTGNGLTVQGNVYLAGSTCPYNSTTDPAVTGSCLANQPVPAVAQTSPKVIVPTAAALGASNGTGANANCTILYPGKYTTPPTFSATRGYYLASGTYYFSAGNLSLNGWVQGGAAAGTPPALSNSFGSRCPALFATDANAKSRPGRSGYSYTGSGVTIILGGNATLRVPNSANNRVELFPRVPSTGSPDYSLTLQTPGVSVWGQKVSTAGVSIPANYAKMSQIQPYYTDGTLSDVVTHGLTWLPDTAVQISPFSNSDAGGTGQLKGGIVAKELLLWLDNISGGVTSTVAGSQTTVAAPRTVVITSVATVAGSAPTTVKVVATFPTTANGYPTILSWRKE